MPGIRPFGAKCARFIRRSPAEDAKINILEGAVRSAKTWGVNAKLIGMLSGAYNDWQWPGGIGLITANSKTSARTNMLSDIFNIIGEKRYRYNQQSGELMMFGKPFLVCGAKDEGAWKSIRGATVGLWIADELTIYPRSFFDMALSRLSLPGSRMYGTTNPGNPYHYLKTDYLDRQELRDNGELWSDHFVLDDNPNIDDRTKESFRRMYTGVFRRWYINGEWCIAEGSIYKDVLTEDVFYDDTTRPIALLSRGGHSEKWVAVDAGTVNAQVYGMFYDDGNTVWLEHEYYFDSRKESRQKTNAEYANDLINGSGAWPGFGSDQRNWPGVIVDPSAASFKIELMNRGVMVVDADNEVEDGIRRVSAMLGRKKLRIHRRCVNGIREMQTYAWSDDKAHTGKEKPIKLMDHFPDMTRYYVQTKINDWRLAA
jgi:PBSX family phage terminase large subunit